jgi:hypothetical protein
MSFSTATKCDYHALLMMLDASYHCIEKRGLAARASHDEYAEQTAQRSLSMLLEATLEALNTHVDGAISNRDLVTMSKTPTAADYRASRDTHLAALEKRFGFSRANLPGWDAVKKTNDQSNSVKHRLGVTVRAGSTTPLDIEDIVDLDKGELLLRMDRIHGWIVALGEACQLS